MRVKSLKLTMFLFFSFKFKFLSFAYKKVTLVWTATSLLFFFAKFLPVKPKNASGEAAYREK